MDGHVATGDGGRRRGGGREEGGGEGWEEGGSRGRAGGMRAGLINIGSSHPTMGSLCKVCVFH